MRNTISKITLTATLAVAITLTLSCSSGDDSGNEPSSGSGTAISSSSDGGGGNPRSSSIGGGGSGLTGTSGTFPDSRDGKSYKWVKIGEQYWMAENLNHNATGSKCYDNLESNCTTYGKLYDWATAVAACPSGWHLPSNAEWGVLMQYVNPSCSLTGTCANAGTKLKATSGWNNNGNGTDDYSFAALPGGYYRLSDGRFDDVGNYGRWWSASEENDDDAYYRSMYYNNATSGGGTYKTSLFSIRCIKDNN
jgi:uncharacterized protein (TIGR02145 family)